MTQYSQTIGDKNNAALATQQTELLMHEAMGEMPLLERWSTCFHYLK